jgi:hypothetical protein
MYNRARATEGFRNWTRNMIFAVRSVYLLRAAWPYWQG